VAGQLAASQEGLSSASKQTSTLLFIHSSLVLQPFVWPLPLSFSFAILYTVGRTPWTEDQPVARPLPTHRTTQPQNKLTQTSMPRVGFEPTTTSVFERTKVVHSLDGAATESYSSVIINVPTVPGEVVSLEAAFPD
jgi:hypothetical protein